MLSSSVVFTKKINLLSLRHVCFFEKFRNFLEEQKQQPELFCKNDVLKFHKIHRKTSVLESDFNKVAASSCLQNCSFIKKRLHHRRFSVNIAKLLRTCILKNICKELFLKKLATSVLALLSNVNYLLTSDKLIRKKIDSF